MISNINTKSNGINYFNAHMEGLGYLDTLVLVNPKPDEDFVPFWSANFCMLEGNPLNPDKTFVSLKIPCKKALNELLTFVDSINNPQIKVFAGLRLAEYRGKPFIFGPQSQNPGKLGINYSAKLINVLHLKIGDQTINLKRNAREASTDFGVTATHSHQNARKEQTPSNVDKPYAVYLSKEEPNFEITKERLKGNGYRWAGDITAWVIPSVKLDKSHPQFHLRVTELAQLGYIWNTQNDSWEYPFVNMQKSRSSEYNRADNQPFAQQYSFQHRH